MKFQVRFAKIFRYEQYIKYYLSFEGDQIRQSFYHTTKVPMAVLWDLVSHVLLNATWTTCQHAHESYTVVMDWHCQVNLTMYLGQPTTNLLSPPPTCSHEVCTIIPSEMFGKRCNGPSNQTFSPLQRFTDSHPFNNRLFVKCSI
jgi:hypothetical protein